MNANPATKPPRIADEAMGRFEVPNCIVPRRFTASIENFLRDNRTGNIQLNIFESLRESYEKLASRSKGKDSDAGDAAPDPDETSENRS